MLWLTSAAAALREARAGRNGHYLRRWFDMLALPFASPQAHKANRPANTHQLHGGLCILAPLGS